MPKCGGRVGVTKMIIYNPWIIDIDNIRIQLGHKGGKIYTYVDTEFHAYFYVACSASPEPCGG